MKRSKKGKDGNREKNKKRPGAPPLKSRISSAAAWIVIGVFVLSVAGLSVFTYKLLYKSDYFVIKTNRMDWAAEPLAKEVYRGLAATGVGENIFSFDVALAADAILISHPELKHVRIRREFPDSLYLNIEPRLPVAQVGDISFFLVDEEAVVLTGQRDSITEGLPLVSGVGWRIYRRVGQREDSPRMLNALHLLEAIGESGLLDEHILTKIDVSDYKNVTFMIEDGLLIKIGHSDFRSRLEELQRTFESLGPDTDEIKYIDLRFDDVVLGTR